MQGYNSDVPEAYKWEPTITLDFHGGWGGLNFCVRSALRRGWTLSMTVTEGWFHYDVYGLKKIAISLSQNIRNNRKPVSYSQCCRRQNDFSPHNGCSRRRNQAPPTPTPKNPELFAIRSFQRGVSHCALPTAMNSAFLLPTFSFHSTSFFPDHLQLWIGMCPNSEFDFNLYFD